ncbi:MAG: hypothetical protein EOP48_27825, partial [Sphingobacteriales bacterium]
MRINYLFAIFAILFISITSCKKKSNTPNDERPDDTAPKREISLDKTAGLPGDIITLKASFVLDKNSWDVTFGEKVTRVIKVNDSTATFSLPYLPSGSYEVNLTQMGIAEKKRMTISNYTPVTDPEKIVGAFESELDNFVIDVDNVGSKEVLTLLQETFDARYALLSADEKKELAYGLQSLSAEVSKLSNAKTRDEHKLSDFTKLSTTKIMLSHPLFPITVPLSFDSDEQYCEGLISCGSLAVLSATLGYTGAHGMAAPTGVTQLLGLAAFSYSLYAGTKSITFYH